MADFIDLADNFEWICNRQQKRLNEKKNPLTDDCTYHYRLYREFIFIGVKIGDKYETTHYYPYSGKGVWEHKYSHFPRDVYQDLYEMKELYCEIISEVERYNLFGRLRVAVLVIEADISNITTPSTFKFEVKAYAT